MKSLCVRDGLTELMSARLHKSAQCTEALKLCRTTAVAPEFDKSERVVCGGNLMEMKTGDLLISGTQETCGKRLFYSFTRGNTVLNIERKIYHFHSVHVLPSTL